MEKYIYKTIIISLLTLTIPTSLIGQTSKLIDVDNSKIKWIGEELSGKNHYGSLKFKDGSLKLDNEDQKRLRKLLNKINLIKQ